MVKKTGIKSSNNGHIDQDDRPYFWTEGHKKIHIRPVAMDDVRLMQDGIEEDYRKMGKPIDPPKIKLAIAGGSSVDRELTAGMIQVADDSEETARRQQLWNDHQAALKEMNDESNDLMMEFILDGIDESMPETDDWTKRFIRRHMQIPDSQEEREIFYKKHILIITPLDMLNLEKEVMIASSSGTLDRKKVDSQMDTFFRKITSKIQNMDITGVTEETTQEQVDT